MRKKITILLFSLLLTFSPLFAQARGLVPCGGYKADGTSEPACTVNDVFYLAARVTNWLIMLAGVYAVFQIIRAGLFMVISQGNEESIKKYRGLLANAIIGFVIVMLAFVMVNTVVNFLIFSKCKVDLTNPTSYISPNQNYNNCVDTTKK